MMDEMQVLCAVIILNIVSRRQRVVPFSLQLKREVV
jgi:hypothetical protein